MTTLTTARLSQDSRASDATAPTERKHILTVGLEDWFQVGAFQQLIHHDQWYRFDTRLDRSTHETLDLLDRFEAHATFFVLGWVAERVPELLAEITERGHEVASRGFHHRGISDMTRDEFRDDVLRTQTAIEAATGHRVQGYRVADGWLGPDDLWALDVLTELGYAYDSSILPMFRTYAHEPHRQFVHQHESRDGALWEIPPSTWRACGLNVPVGGGNWFRQLPHTLLKHAVNSLAEHSDHPLVLYFHTWELDPQQPRITSVGRVARLRHYRNLDKMRWVMEEHLSKHNFDTIANYLRLPAAEVVGLPPAVPVPAAADRARPRLSSQPRTAVSIVIPCFNEEATLSYLANTLERVEFELSGKYEPHFILVDDCSTDTTWDTMQTVFSQKDNCRLLHHESNRGVSAAILTGMRAAKTEVVCSMDCDCSYDPLELAHMLPLLTDDVDLVTASPYHPSGHVKNVPGWRLFLSKGLSQLYRLVLRRKLHTWTSCFRIYRKSAVEDVVLEENGFLGTAELVARLAQRGSEIIEHPATLEVRIFGESKMKTCRTIVGHLRLIARILSNGKPVTSLDTK